MPDPRPLIDDQVTVSPGDTLLRVIQPQFQKPDGTFQSNGFQDQRRDVARDQFGLEDACASVALRSIWEAESGKVEDLLRDFPAGSALAELAVRDVRELKTLGGQAVPQGVMLDPREGQPWHAVLFGVDVRPRKKAGNRALAEQATWFWRPS